MVLGTTSEMYEEYTKNLGERGSTSHREEFGHCGQACLRLLQIGGPPAVRTGQRQQVLRPGRAHPRLTDSQETS